MKNHNKKDFIKVTLNVNPKLHQFIKQVQVELRKKEGKTLSLDKIMMNFAKIGILTQNNEQSTQIKKLFEQEKDVKTQDFTHNVMYLKLVGKQRAICSTRQLIPCSF